MNIVVPVFRGQYLGVSDKITSAPIPTRGNKVVAAILVLNVTGAPSGTFAIDGSYDGVSWTLGIGTATVNTFGPGSISKTGLDYAFIRIRAENSVASTAILFDVTCVFSEQ